MACLVLCCLFLGIFGCCESVVLSNISNILVLPVLLVFAAMLRLIKCQYCLLDVPSSLVVKSGKVSQPTVDISTHINDIATSTWLPTLVIM